MAIQSHVCISAVFVFLPNICLCFPLPLSISGFYARVLFLNTLSKMSRYAHCPASQTLSRDHSSGSGAQLGGTERGKNGG